MIYEVVIQAVEPARREDHVANYKNAFRAWHPRGAHGGKILRCVEDPSRLTIVIEWDDVEAHTRHRGTEGHVKFREAIDTYMTEPSQVLHYLIEEL